MKKEIQYKTKQIITKQKENVNRMKIKTKMQNK